MTPTQYIPPNLGTVTPYLSVRPARDAIDLYRALFDATEIERQALPDGRVLHTKLRIGDSTIELGEHADDAKLQGPDRLLQVGLHVYVEDVDTLVDRATAHGIRVVGPAEEQPYGDRDTTIADPFAIIWYVATHVRT